MKATRSRADFQIVIWDNFGSPPVPLFPFDHQHVIGQGGAKDEIFFGWALGQLGLVRAPQFLGQSRRRNGSTTARSRHGANEGGS